MTEGAIEHIVILLGYAGIFLLMIANGAISFPSSQILYIIAGYFIFVGDLHVVPVVICGAIGNTIGNILLYELAKRKGIEYLTRWPLFPLREISKVQIAFQKRGAFFLFVGKLLPAIKVLVPIPAGIAKMNLAVFAGIVLIASAIWTAPFLAIGYYFGKSADVFGPYAVVLVIIALVVATLFYRYINSEAVVQEAEGIKSRSQS
jgi:membrane protein DedA with SNARE-associated domain